MDQKTDRQPVTRSHTTADLLPLPTALLFVLANTPGAYWRNGDRIPDAVFNTLAALRWKRNTHTFARSLGYLPNYAAPRSYCEKIQWRKAFDRNPLFPLLSDKLAVRELVRTRAPDLAFPQLYWSGTNPDAIPFDDLRPPFVVKPNNRSGRFVLVRDDHDFDRSAITSHARKWMKARPHNWRFGEWAYGRTESRILVEEFLGGGPRPPPNFKILVFAGRAAYVFCSEGSHSGPAPRRGFYTPDWQLLPLDKWRKQGRVVLPGGVERPERLGDLIAAAEAIAAGLDHLRVDLYLIGDRIYFGEATIYNYSGHGTWMPKETEDRSPQSLSFDETIGALWTLPSISRREQWRRLLSG